MDTRELRARAEAAKSSGVYDPAREAFYSAASPTVILSLLDQLEAMRKALQNCNWYWPADDTSSDACADSPGEIYEGLYVDPGTIIEYSRGGVVESGFYGRLPAADDADSDDDFEVDEPTEEAAQAKMQAELARRAALPTTSTEEGVEG